MSKADEKFNDPETPDPNYWPSVRLADVCAVARRFERSGMRYVEVEPENLKIRFIDPVIKGDNVLEIVPWFGEGTGWFWYADIRLPNGFSMGPMARRRMILNSPWPSEVVRAYFRTTWYERRLPVKKKRGR